jgi:hypothetical protein
MTPIHGWKCFLIPYLNCGHGLKSNVLALCVGLERKFVVARGCGGSGRWMHLYSTADVTEEIQYQDSYRKVLFSLFMIGGQVFPSKCSIRACSMHSLSCFYRRNKCIDDKASLVSSSKARSTRCWKRRESDYLRRLHHSRLVNRGG